MISGDLKECDGSVMSEIDLRRLICYYHPYKELKDGTHVHRLSWIGLEGEII